MCQWVTVLHGIPGLQSCALAPDMAACQPYHLSACVPLSCPCSNPLLCVLCPAGTKKVPKAYVVAVSPVRPNLAAVGANTGMAFMTFDRMYPLPVAGLPLHNLAAAHDSPALRLPQEPVAAAYVAHMGDAVWLVNCTAAEKVGRKYLVVGSVGSRVTQLLTPALWQGLLAIRQHMSYRGGSCALAVHAASLLPRRPRRSLAHILLCLS